MSEAAFCVLLLYSAAPERQERPDIYSLRAVWINKLVEYHAWHADRFRNDDEEFVIGVFRAEPALIDGARFAAGRIGRTRVRAGSRAVPRTIRVLVIESLDEVSKCHLLYIGELADAGEYQQALAKVAGAGCLTIGLTEAFLESGGCLCLDLESTKSKKVRINVEALRRQKIEPDPRLLSLADPYRSAHK